MRFVPAKVTVVWDRLKNALYSKFQSKKNTGRCIIATRRPIWSKLNPNSSA